MIQDNLIHINIEDFADYLKDESRISGKADSISFPQNSKELYSILTLMRDQQKCITIQGARTGITGGAVPNGGHILNLGSHEMVVGQIEEIYASDSCLTDGEPDVTKIKPFLWVRPPTNQYWDFGKPIGEAFSIGKQINKRL